MRKLFSQIIAAGCFSASVFAQSLTYQVEDIYTAETNVIIYTGDYGQTGSGSIGSAVGTNRMFEFYLDGGASGMSTNLNFRYSLHQDRNASPVDFYVNDVLIGSNTFAKTDRWYNWEVDSIEASLAAGSNKITVVGGAEGLPHIDKMFIGTGDPEAPYFFQSPRRFNDAKAGSAYSETIYVANWLNSNNGDDVYDPNGDDVTFEILSGPAWLSVVSTNGALSGTPTEPVNYPVATNEWEILCSDGILSSTGTIQIVVKPLYSTPYFNDDPTVKPFAESGVVYSNSIAADATDEDGDSMSFIKINYTGPGDDWLTVSTNGTLSGTPDKGNLGTGIWAVEVSDGSLMSTGTVHIPVIAGSLWSEDFEAVSYTEENDAGYYLTAYSYDEWVNGQAGALVDNAGDHYFRVNAKSGPNDRNEGGGTLIDGSGLTAGQYDLTFDHVFRNSGGLGVRVWEVELGTGTIGIQTEDNAGADNERLTVYPTGDATTNLLVESVWYAAPSTKSVSFEYDGTGDLVFQFWCEGNNRASGIDNLVLTISDPFYTWADSYGLTKGKNGDDDDDTLNNFYEYGLGGNPTNGFVEAGVLPVIESGSGDMKYIHAQRNDTTALNYYLELAEDLAFPAWTNDGYTVEGTYAPGGDIDYVTNSIPTDTSTKFIHLIIE